MRLWLIREDDDAAARLGDAAAPGLRVYQNNYRAQLAACLEDCFERTRDWIGDEAFHRAVVAHVDRVPPNSWTLDAYGRDFPATLAILYPADAEVAELAWLDMALGEAFVAADAPALTADDLAGVDWDRAVLHVTPTLDMGDLTTNATAIWSALADGETPPAVETLPEPGAILVWRQDDISRFRAADQYERQALLSIRAGMPFPDLCEAMVGMLGEGAGIARAGQMLGRWISDGLIVAVQPSLVRR
ncbi:MAG: DNA-binding domain-containing protein [Sphingomonas bacterium]